MDHPQHRSIRSDHLAGSTGSADVRSKYSPGLNRKGQAAKVRLDCIAAPAVANVCENCNPAEIRERRLAAKGRASSASLTLSQAG